MFFIPLSDFLIKCIYIESRSMGLHDIVEQKTITLQRWSFYVQLFLYVSEITFFEFLTMYIYDEHSNLQPKSKKYIYNVYMTHDRQNKS